MGMSMVTLLLHRVHRLLLALLAPLDLSLATLACLMHLQNGLPLLAFTSLFHFPAVLIF
jgi:hypothetical protein